MRYQIVVVVTTMWVSLSCLGVISGFTMAVEIAPRITDREIVESLTEIKEGIKRLETEIKGDIKRLETEIKGDIKRLETEIKGDIKRLEEGQNSILREMDKRFEAVDERFEAVNKRFDDVNNRFEDVNKQFDRLISVFIGIVATFGGIVAVTISLAIWDRKTALRPALKRSDDLEKREERVEVALKDFAKEEPRLREILRRVGIL